MNRRVVAGLNGGVLIFWISFFGLMGAFTLGADIRGEGLKGTQAFLVLGYLLYPLFYGAIAFLLIRFASMFRRRREFLNIGDGTVAFGRTTIPFGDVREVHVGRNWLGVKQLVVLRNEGADYRLAGFALSRPVADVVADLRIAIPTQTPR